MSHPYLIKLVDDLDKACGYSGRYTLIRRSAPPHSGWAIMKKEGQLDRNVSGWGTPLQLKFWVLGHLEGYSAHERRFDASKAKPSDLPDTAYSFDPATLGDVHGTKIP